jgi:hypothetical protein
VPCRSIPDEKSKIIPVPGGRFYLHFELSLSYAQNSSQGLRESPAISVLIDRKIQHAQIGAVPVVLSVAFPFFMSDLPSFFQKNSKRGV